MLRRQILSGISAVLVLSMLAGCAYSVPAPASQEPAASQTPAATSQTPAASEEQPAAEQAAPDAEQVQQDQEGGTEMAEGLKWWQKTNVCEIYVRSFNDTDGDGIGDLNGVTEKLDYLKELGVGAIWLTPCFKSPQADNGYDVADYCAIDEMFGTMEDMDRLIEEAGKRDIRIVMDLVFNHISDQHDWFLESASSRDNDKSDWYIWRDAKPDGSEPTNWRSIFGGSAWTWSETRGQYYLHTFLKEQPDLNWANPEVRQALYDAAQFWVDKGVGGFRLDAVTYIKKPDFADGEPDAGDGLAAIHPITANTEGILDYLHEFKDNVLAGTDLFTVGEANGVSAEELPQWVGSSGVFDMVFEFSHVLIDLENEADWSSSRPWTLADLKKILRDSQANTAEDGWYAIFFENHDQPRCVDHFFPETADKDGAAKVIGTLMMTLRGTPFLYQGQALGLQNVAWDDISAYNDISTINHYDFLIQEGHSEEDALDAIHHFSRDSARTPMPWNAEENAGFTTGTPWLPLNEGYETRNAEAEAEDPDSVLSWYRALADLRAAHSELTGGTFEELLEEHEQIFAYIRKSADAEAIILANFSEEEATYDPALVEGAELLLSSAGSASQPDVLAPLECVIYER